jgi:hypothetical protein
VPQGQDMLLPYGSHDACDHPGRRPTPQQGALRRLSHQGVALLLARLVHTSIAVLGFLISISVIAPSFQTADLIKNRRECFRHTGPCDDRDD